MRTYKTVATENGTILATRYAATQALAKQDRDDLKTLYGLKQSQVSSEEHEIPTAKAELLEFVNQLSTQNDAPVE